MLAYYIATPEQITDMAPCRRTRLTLRPSSTRSAAGTWSRAAWPTRWRGSWDPGFMVLIEFPTAERVLEF